MPKKYRVFIAGAARKELSKLGKSAAAEILRQIDKKLPTNPTEYGDPLSRELAGYYKLRVSGFRVVYRVLEDRVLVLVLAVGRRREGDAENIYDWLTAETLMDRLEALIRKIEMDLKD